MSPRLLTSDDSVHTRTAAGGCGYTAAPGTALLLLLWMVLLLYLLWLLKLLSQRLLVWPLSLLLLLLMLL